MSHITNVKKLLSEDLKGLISHYTGFKEGTLEFNRCEDTLWSIIFDKYYPSINEHRVKSTLNEFVDKFKVHGFPQKARNLTTLISAYTQSPYFKKYSNTEVQWGLIDLLIKLSFKPTNALEDDPPLDLTKKIVKEDDAFDWGAYLKEGLEKYHLPPDERDDSLSDWSDEETKDPVPNLFDGVQTVQSDEKNISRPLVPACDTRLEILREAEKATAWVEEYTQCMWWTNEALREIPPSQHPEANYLFTWEKLTGNEGKTRVLSEYKVLRELIYMLALPSECYFIEEVSKDSFKVKPRISISSLSPNVFSAVIEENFCVYFPHIKKLQSFCSEMDCVEMPSHVPAAFRAYGSRIQKILNAYHKKLFEIEKRTEAQESITTIRYLLAEITPFLNQMEFLSRLHDEATNDWKEKDQRSNAFRLLCVLYDELKHPKKWKTIDTAWVYRTLLLLFTESLRPFLLDLARHMTGHSYKNTVDEFFLNSSGEIIVEYEGLESSEFWEPTLKTAAAAVTSSSFLTQLDIYTTFFKGGYPEDILFLKLVEKLHELLLYKSLGDEIIENSDAGKVFDSYHKELYDGSFWDRYMECLEKTVAPNPKLFRKTAGDRLAEALCDIDLSTSALFLIVRNALTSVIEEYMEPKGFASEILLNQLKLLEHLSALFSAIQVTSELSTYLIKQASSSRGWRKIRMKFEKCLSDVLPDDYAQKFRLSIDQNMPASGITILEFPDYIRIHYKTDSRIKFVITKKTMAGYEQIFCFLLKTRLALATLNGLILEEIDETPANALRLKRLFSLRLWFIHALNSLNLYFSTFSDVEFQENMKHLCLNERKFCSINTGHSEFVKNWKYHCFLSENHPCHENILELFSLCTRLSLYWKLEQKNQLADHNLDDIESYYCDCLGRFALSLQLFDDRLLDRNDTFSFLYDEITNNLPASKDEETA